MHVSAWLIITGAHDVTAYASNLTLDSTNPDFSHLTTGTVCGVILVYVRSCQVTVDNNRACDTGQERRFVPEVPRSRN